MICDKINKASKLETIRNCVLSVSNKGVFCILYSFYGEAWPLWGSVSN